MCLKNIDTAAGTKLQTWCPPNDCGRVEVMIMYCRLCQWNLEGNERNDFSRKYRIYLI